VPTFNDDLAEIGRIGRFLGDLEGVNEIHVLPYHKSGIDKYRRLGQEYGMEYAVGPPKERLQLIAARLGKYVARVVIGG
jgi:pyruvate formate lyase activating enzyme